MPVKGISLPFLTYGGSSLFSNMIAMGIVLSIRKTFGQYMFANKGTHQKSYNYPKSRDINCPCFRYLGNINLVNLEDYRMAVI